MAGPPGSTVLAAAKPVPATRDTLATGSGESVRRPLNPRSSGGLDPNGRDLANVFRAFRMPRIVSGLHACPDAGTVSDKRGAAKRACWRHRLSFLQNIVKMLTRN